MPFSIPPADRPRIWSDADEPLADCERCDDTGEVEVYDSSMDINPIYTEWCTCPAGQRLVQEPQP